MSTPADDILAAVKAIVEAARPGETVHPRRASEKNPIFAHDMTLPCWAVDVNDDRPTEMAYAGKAFVKYPTTLTYLTRELPGDRAASAAVEAALDVARKLFQASRDAAGKPGLEGVASFNKCDVAPRKPYTLPQKDQTVNCSPLLLTIETLEDAQ